jgi:hypothetical protein
VTSFHFGFYLQNNDLVTELMMMMMTLMLLLLLLMLMLI